MLRLTFIFLLLSQICLGQIKPGVYITKEDTIVLKGFNAHAPKGVTSHSPIDVMKYTVGDTTDKAGTTKVDTTKIQEIIMISSASLAINNDGTFDYRYAPTISCLTWRDWKGRYIVKGNELHLNVSAVGGYLIVYGIEKNKLKFIRKQKESYYETLPLSEEEMTFKYPLSN
jgi:hypothetical protein